MRYIHFIVNPISGHGKHSITVDYLASHFPPDDYRIEVHYTKYKGHAVALAKTAVALNAHTIVACGGDGTINEVASCLVHTDILLGIIPIGSGNGLASHLQIPRELDKAIAILKMNSTFAIDVGSVNGRYFFSNTGVGIDAMIIKKYEQYSRRTLPAYVRAAFSSALTFKPRTAIVRCNGETINTKPYLLFISNSNQMGYNMGLTPEASLNDGLLDVVIVPPLSFIRKVALGCRLIKNTAPGLRELRYIKTEKLNIELPENIFTDIQADGEYHNVKTNIIEIKLIEKGLNVLIH